MTVKAKRSRKKHVAITQALVGTRLMLNRRPEAITISAADIAPIVAALKGHGFRITRAKRGVAGRKLR